LRVLPGDPDRVSIEWVKNVLDPKKVVSALIHSRKYEVGVSTLEADLVTELVIGYYEMSNIVTKKKEKKFWRDELGVVAPHNAQGRLIIRKIFDRLTDSKLTHLEYKKLMSLISNAVYSVEKFQGSDREMIISSIGLSDKDQLNSESEFIYNLNRFNVLTSRAKSKLILIASEKYLKFIPMDRLIIKESAHIRKYARNFCNLEENIKIVNERNEKENLIFRYRLI
jgi:superfamily I DNA and/or RNA helicase